MSGFKELDFLKRQEAAAIAKKAALEKFRAKAADPALADRLTERAARAADRGLTGFCFGPFFSLPEGCES